jgi:hypothetical protein
MRDVWYRHVRGPKMDRPEPTKPAQAGCEPIRGICADGLVQPGAKVTGLRDEAASRAGSCGRLEASAWHKTCGVLVGRLD